MIQIGLLFSVVGDLLLIYGENGKSPLFIPGVALFALAQMFYIMSFGYFKVARDVFYLIYF